MFELDEICNDVIGIMEHWIDKQYVKLVYENNIPNHFDRILRSDSNRLR